MGDVPEPSSAPYFCHGKAGENFARLCQLIITICSDVLRDVFSRYVKPADLRKKLDREKATIERNLSHQQKTELYPQTPSVASMNIRAKNFDISLLYTLLRNICGIKVCDLPAHKKNGWGKTPPPGDYCLCACIEIIRETRNKVTGHLGTGAVDNKDFYTYWNQLKEAVLAIERDITGADMYERGIEELYKCDLNQTTSAKYIREFADIRDAINLKRERMEDLETTSHNMGEQLKVKQEKLDTQEMRLQKLEREMTLNKRQSMKQGNKKRLLKRKSDQSTKQEENLIKRITEQSMKQEDRLVKRITELEESLAKRVTDHQLIYKSFCTIHPTLVCFMFCIPCQVPVCAKCIIEKHQQHVLDELIKNGIVYIKMKMTGTVRKVTEFETSLECIHMSCVTSDKAWIGEGNRLALVNVQGDVLKEKRRRRSNIAYSGDSTVTSDGELLLIDGNCIKRITHDDDIRTIIVTDMIPLCIYSSLINGDIIVGFGVTFNFSITNHLNFETLKVVRYNAAGEKLREINVQDNSSYYYTCIKHITENRLNRDICSILSGDLSLKVLGTFGENRFTYTGRNESIIIGSVTTDILGHILLPMRDHYKEEIHVDMLDHNGNFQRTFLTTTTTMYPSIVSICVDNLHRLWFAQDDRVQIYGYLEE